ncbi:TVP38/TMEM64 family protein [Alkalibacter saccharofermentans]|uniref:TVP38/TMEM64 family membrane protein n=1 Tax=Alkalibacter saccharofermentans DSM 14828 TaxID=1120975 RepID=A0A1M4WM36_9FIRM|nr:VTT domain-containing protein [Alkalibacter saccharofermentans]SHE82319.1 Uncharacterized membrane protein YdjX, TVP38/TMEM64 family, SNARE-associated domain [Alkalibacter saccharofermentans DSM 14828]
MIGLIKHHKILTVLIIALLLLAVMWLAGTDRMEIADMLSYEAESPFMASGIIILWYLAKTVLVFIPMKGLFIATGLILPFHLAILTTFTGLYLHLSVGYLLGRRFGKDRVEKMIEGSKKAHDIMEYGEKNGLVICAASRNIPGPPVDIVNMFFGAAGVPYPIYITGSLLGFAPGVFLFTLMGESADDPTSPAFILPVIIALGISFAVARGYKKFSRKNEEEKI